MTLTQIVQILLTAPTSSIDPDVMERIKSVDMTSEQAVRGVLDGVNEAGFYGSVSPVVATLCDPKFTKDYSL